MALSPAFARRATTAVAPALRSSLFPLHSGAVPAEARGIVAAAVRQMATSTRAAPALAASPWYRALAGTPLAAQLRPPVLPALASLGKREFSVFMRMANYVTRGVDADALRRFERAANQQAGNVAAQMLYLQALQK
jgi:DNA-binding transcriptional regulator YdaS (Cro superfamily)